jgi:hypothetical protein
MHRSETRDRDRCLDCGAEISDTRDRAYVTGEDEGLLCFECALRRGGKYDEARDHWDTPPTLGDLPRSDRDSSRLWK